MDTAYVEKRCKGLTKGGKYKAKDKLDKLQTAVETYALDKGTTLKDKKLDSEIKKELQRLMKAGLMENESVHPPDTLVGLKALAGQIDLIKKDEKRVKYALKAYLKYKHQQKNAEVRSFSNVVVFETDRKKVSKTLGALMDQRDISRTTLKKDLVDHSGNSDLGDELKVFLDDAMLKDLMEVRREYLTERAQVALAKEYGVAVQARQDARNDLGEAMQASPDAPTDPTELKKAYDRVYSMRTVMAELFEENFMNEKGKAILTLSIGKGSWDKDLKKGMATDELKGLVTTGRGAIDDVPEIRLRGDTRLLKLTEEFKDQRTVATMMILLNNREFGPFIVDEPEQHLDNESVFKHLVPRLRQLKDRQQLIMVTRNANIPLSGDAENIIISKAKDAKLSKIVVSGSLDLEEINDVGATILEGGFDAFNSRKLKYTLFEHGP